MVNASPSSSDRQWIKANVFGAMAYAFAGFFGFGLNELLGISGGGAGDVASAIFAVLSVLANALGLGFYGFLIGIVLRQKIPRFPMRNWVGLFAAFGVTFGTLTVSVSLQSAGVETAASTSYEITRETMLGACIGGAILGAITGALQAMILIPVASGLRTWVELSAIAGLIGFALLVATSALAPVDSFASELTTEITLFAATVLGAFIMLPAFWGLQPRRA
jgi:hypothetical protein